MSTFPAVKITDNIYWVGAIDWTIRDFHGYRTGRGSTYNAYLVCADRITLIDTVKKPFCSEMMARIASVIDPERIDSIVSNHSEMDHSGGLPEVIAAVKPERVYASVMGQKALNEHFGIGNLIHVVKSGDRIDLGSMTLEFLETRMLHWPDSMFTYCTEEKVLFSQDAFGMHLATAERFADEIDPSILAYEAATYYANILLPYSKLITKLAETLSQSTWKPAIIAPDHGPVWRKDLGTIIGRYTEWALQRSSRKAVIVYDTMWHSTEQMARAIAEGTASRGVDVKIMPASLVHRSDVAYEILDAGALLAGSPTLNNNLFPSMADVLTYLKGLKPQNLIGAAFGSYGWSGESVKQVEEMLAAMKVSLVGESLACLYAPDQNMLEKCFSLGVAVGDELIKRCDA